MPLGALRRLPHPGSVRGRAGSDEHSDLAATHAARPDSGAFERLPADLQQQPLLRVHGQRLTRRDPEERRVEQRDVVQETALAHVGLARLVRVTVVQVGHIPAPVGRESGDGVTSGDQQLPQLLRRVHPAGEPAAHGDDRDGLVTHRPRRHHRSSRRHHTAGDLAGHVPRQHHRRRVVEHQGRGQPQLGRHLQPVAQFHRGHRVEAEVLERAVRVHQRRRVVAEDRGDLGANQLQQGLLALGRGQPGQPTGQRLRSGLASARLVSARLGHQPADLRDLLEQ